MTEMLSSEEGWLAYQTLGSQGFDRISLVRVDGTDDHSILDELDGNVRHPDFSRDGSRLAFDQLESDESADQVYVANADGTAAKPVARCDLARCLSYWEPAWSPDGTHLAISTAAGPLTDKGPSGFGIAIVDVDSGAVRQMLDHPSQVGQDHFPRWSPDGERLVFWRGRYAADGSPQTAIFLVNVDGSGLRQLTPWNMLAGDPDWAPDGSLIVFNTRPLLEFGEDGRSELYTMHPDGSQMLPLTSYGDDGARATQARWTPDGRAIIYTRVTQSGSPRHVWAISADGRIDVPILETDSIYTHPVLQPMAEAR
ncbi:MAG TPA: hypothetical protein VG929_12245 [Actinomycetota bacterium]|nr:hypothetical protein [Actinomycetota bacterium]